MADAVLPCRGFGDHGNPHSHSPANAETPTFSRLSRMWIPAFAGIKVSMGMTPKSLRK